MDEAGLQTLLNRLADTEPPPTRIDLDAAIARGRRGRRWRRVRAGVSVLLAAGAVAAVVAVLLVPAQPSAQRPDQQPTDGPTAPTRFNPLVPYAEFGWLPPGFEVGVRGGTMSRSGPAQLLLDAFSGSNTIIQLFVYPTGICHVGHAEVCSAYDSSQPVLSRAPDVHGHRAYWLRTASLTWEYAPGAWSVLSWPAISPWPPTGSERAAVLRVAAGLRYGQTAPIRFPYWISGLAAPWRVSNVDYTLLAGRPVAQTLEVSNGPSDAAHVDYLDVDFTPAAHSDWSCPTEGVQHVTVDGVAAVLENSPGADRVCIPGWRRAATERHDRLRGVSSTEPSRRADCRPQAPSHRSRPGALDRRSAALGTWTTGPGPLNRGDGSLTPAAARAWLARFWCSGGPWPRSRWPPAVTATRRTTATERNERDSEGSGGPGHLSPGLPQIPYVTVSRHTALLTLSSRTASPTPSA